MLKGDGLDLPWCRSRFPLLYNTIHALHHHQDLRHTASEYHHHQTPTITYGNDIMLAASIQYATTALRGLINKGRQFGRQMAEERKAKKEQKEREHARRVLAAGQGGTKSKYLLQRHRASRELTEISKR